MKLIEFKNVSFGYQEDQLKLFDLNFVIEKNKNYILLGKNGCGKSSLAKLILGIERVKEGEIYYLENLINEKNYKLLNENSVIVFQNPDNQFVTNNVKDEIIFGLENYGVNPNEMDNKVNDISQVCKIEHLLKRNPNSLSGGEKQKVALASVLVLNPTLLILDEAFTMLDNNNKSELKKIISDYQKENKITIINITHDQNEIYENDHIFFLEGGKLYQYNNPSEFFKEKRHEIFFPPLERIKSELNINKEDLSYQQLIKEIKEKWL